MYSYLYVRQASLHSEMYDLRHKYDSDVHTRTVELDMITAEHDRATQKIQLLSKEACAVCESAVCIRVLCVHVLCQCVCARVL